MGTPTFWASSLFMQKKKIGKMRRTIDLQKVNAATLRETNYTHILHGLVCDIPKNQYKTVMDCWNSYHSVDAAITQTRNQCRKCDMRSPS